MILGMVALGQMARAETSVSLGVGAAPDYLGSDDIVAVPLPGFAFNLGDVAVKSNGLGVEVDVAAVAGAPRGIGFGPILRFDLGRNDGMSVKDDIVARTAPIQAAPEVGGFVDLAAPLGGSGLIGTARLSVVHGLGDGPRGDLAEASLGVLGSTGAWTLGGQLTASTASGDYQDAVFGVSAADAAATGLPIYAAKWGLRDVGIGGFASYAVNDRLAVNMIVGLTRLAKSAANSPLVADRGARNQTFVGLGLTYSFQ